MNNQQMKLWLKRHKLLIDELSNEKWGAYRDCQFFYDVVVQILSVYTPERLKQLGFAIEAPPIRLVQVGCGILLRTYAPNGGPESEGGFDEYGPEMKARLHRAVDKAYALAEKMEKNEFIENEYDDIEITVN